MSLDIIPITVDAETVLRIEQSGQPLVVYDCKLQVSAHLRRHGITGPDSAITTCTWDGCYKTLKKGSMARHILTHLRVKCRYDLFREHVKSPGPCHLAIADTVPGPGGLVISPMSWVADPNHIHAKSPDRAITSVRMCHSRRVIDENIMINEDLDWIDICELCRTLNVNDRTVNQKRRSHVWQAKVVEESSAERDADGNFWGYNSSRVYALMTASTVWVNIMSDVDWEGTDVGDSLMEAVRPVGLSDFPDLSKKSKERMKNKFGGGDEETLVNVISFENTAEFSLGLYRE
ncbi:uncharacterized protein HD556DRAFT_1537692 [Suillus plorans]|uniref:Uncharacterized protein n=1 Tax=Suillus plorans TaxID=116603 RepID=A0A9P7AJE7_9AGAM|nr:uncharacterized protein HD556DRAFT_1537692 [Suillus plorans]KAG1790719.1 hypothetical protein HD556DRAFT_1537692 [Suillus plorans]